MEQAKTIALKCSRVEKLRCRKMEPLKAVEAEADPMLQWTV